MHVNMNHAATSARKPKEVTDALIAFLREDSHHSAGRGGNELAAAEMALECRIALAEFFGARSPKHVIFTSGATESLNMAIQGIVRDGCHVVATSLEHNAVARPLELLRRQGRIDVTWLPSGPDGGFDPESIRDAVTDTTRLLVMTHASNVLGNVLPVAESFRIAKEYGLFTVLDAAQTAGHMDVRLNEDTDIIAFTGHKGLRGIAGIGGLVLNEPVTDALQVWKAGGTGSHSQSLEMPRFLPDKLEPGTANRLGIRSLHAAVRAITSRGIEAIQAHEGSLTARLMDGLEKLPVETYGTYDRERRMPVVSLNISGMDAGIVSRRLFEEYGIETRSGLHCSPLAHTAIGTFPHGTVRLSWGMDTTIQEVDYTLDTLKKITMQR